MNTTHTIGRGDNLRPGRANAAAWAAQAIAALIFAQTLYFKFQAAPESVHIFSTLGVEPWGRIAAGAAELIAAIALLQPRWNWMGAALGLSVMAGAIGSHLLVLGIEVQDDGGLLFGLAVAVATCCGAVLWLRRAQWIGIVSRKSMPTL